MPAPDTTPASVVVEAIQKMPNLSPTVAKVLALVNDPNSSARDLIRVIQIDPVLTGKVLALCNSAYFGIPTRVSSVARATILLGMNTIKNLALTTAVLALFSKAPRTACFDSAAFWRHSLGCAVASQLIASKMRLNRALQEEFFIAGLLHETGRLVIVHQLPETCRKIAEQAALTPEPISQIERTLVGAPHTEIGLLLAEKWNLADHLATAVRYHHEPREAERFPEIAAACYIADNYCHETQIGYGGDTPSPEHLDAVSEMLGKPLADMTEALADKLHERLDQASIFVRPGGG